MPTSIYNLFKTASIAVSAIACAQVSTSSWRSSSDVNTNSDSKESSAPPISLSPPSSSPSPSSSSSTTTTSPSSSSSSSSPSSSSPSSPSTPRPWWYYWLVSKNDNQTNVPVRPFISAPGEQPGRVLAWGGVFGRSPVEISVLGERVVCAAAGSNGIGAAVDADGRALVFYYSEDGIAQHEKVALPVKVKRVAWREAHDEAVFVDVHGDIHVARVVITDLNENGHDLNQKEKIVINKLRRVDLLPGRRFVRRGSAMKVSCGSNKCIALCQDGTAYRLQSFKSASNSSSTIDKKNVAEGIKNESEEDLYATPILRPPGAKRLIDAACSDGHVVLLDSVGTLYTGGSDRWGELGREAMPWKRGYAKSVIEQPLSLDKASLFSDLAGTAIATGQNHTAMLVADGTLFTCGYNQFGQLGHHNYATFAPPSPTADITLRAIAVAAAGNHTCVVTAGGTLRCAGANESGQLGLGTLQSSQTWRKVKHKGKAIRPTSVIAGTCTTVVVVPVTPKEDA